LSAAADQIWGFRGQLLGIAAASSADLAALDTQAGPFVFPLLADEQGTVARAYSAWNAGSGTVRDVTCMVDKSGKIVWVGEGSEATKPAVLVRAFRDIAR
jgi:peroxiredoxin